jgi:hypothetical protein
MSEVLLQSGVYNKLTRDQNGGGGDLITLVILRQVNMAC